jgi:hypothetical protein
MLWAMSTAPSLIPRIAIITVIAFVALNIAFYLMSGSYFESHHEVVAGVGSMPAYSADQAMHVRMTFAVFSAVVAVFGFAAAIRPRVVGHLIPVLLAAGYLVGAIAAITHNAPGVVGMTLLVAGVLMPVLAWHSLHRSRPAWAFLVAICGVFAVVELFGAPKVRGALDVSLWLTMILPGLNVVAVAALISLRADYLDREPVLADRPSVR